jgi:glycosyltransferase involved in cell wall biosynthesis
MPSSRLRILYNHRTRARDGQSVHIDELIGAFQAQGHIVHVTGPRRIEALQRGPERRLLPEPIYELAELAFSGIELFQILLAARRLRPDFIYQRANVHMLGALCASRILGIPLFLEVNAPLAKERGRTSGFAWPGLARWSEKYLWRHADRLLPVTRVLAQELIESGVCAERIAVVANGVDPARFAHRDRQTAKAAAGLGKGLVLGFIGYVRKWHGLEHVIDLLARDERLSGAHLVVVGDGPARADLKSRAQRLGVAGRVFFTGVVVRDDVANIAAAFDIALQPDVTAYASPLKLFEYMALGHAIVAPNTANIREVLDNDENALLFSPGDFGALATAVGRLAADPMLRQQLGWAASQDIASKNRTWAANACKIAELFAELRPARKPDEVLVVSADPV